MVRPLAYKSPKKMNKIVILHGNGGRLANQLWLYTSVYTYCLEKKYDCENPSFFQYSHYFNTPVSPSVFSIFFNNARIRRSEPAKKLYSRYVRLKKIFYKNNIVEAKDNEFILPPDKSDNVQQKNILQRIEKSENKTFYFCGWLFRNPKSWEKYHEEVKEYFKPKQEYQDKIDAFIGKLRDNGKRLVGVHIRHGDYKTWNDGKFFYSFEEVRDILESYLEKQENSGKVIFVLCSDEKINDAVFAGLPYVKGLGSEIEDLFTLAATDVIIGTNSTFGPWAAYYGNIPYIYFPEKK
jgi:hypothetical protein